MQIFASIFKNILNILKIHKGFLRDVAPLKIKIKYGI